MIRSPFFPSGSPSPLRDGSTPFFAEHDRDPRDPPGLAAPPFSVCAVGPDYYRKCGPADTDWDPPACGGGGFRLLSIAPGANPDEGPPSYEFRSTLINVPFVGPLVLTFNAPPDPDTLTTLQEDAGGVTPPGPWSGPESLRATYDLKPSLLPMSFAVVGNTIEITNSDGNEWGFGSTGVSGELYVQLTADLLDADGRPLANPGDAAFWAFISDD